MTEIARLEWTGEETIDDRDLLHSAILDTDGIFGEYEGETLYLYRGD